MTDDAKTTLAEAVALEIRELRLVGAGFVVGGGAFGGLSLIYPVWMTALAVAVSGFGLWLAGNVVSSLTHVGVGVGGAGGIPLLDLVVGFGVDPLYVTGFFVVFGLVALIFAPQLSGYAGADDRHGKI